MNLDQLMRDVGEEIARLRSRIVKLELHETPFVAGSTIGSGSVTSVGLALPAIFAVSGSPITSSGTLTATLATQAANRVWAGPTSGADAVPTFRPLDAINDIPSLDAAKIGSGTLALARGGTGANLSATGPGLLQQTTAGGTMSVAPTPAGRLLIGAAGGAGVTTDGKLAWDGATLTITGNVGLTGNVNAAGNIGGFTGSFSVPLGIASGGTGAATLTSGGVLLGNGTAAISAITGTANQVLAVPGGGGAPVFTTLAKINLPTAIAYEDEANTFTAAPRVQNYVDLDEIAAPPAPAANTTRLFAPTTATQYLPLAAQQAASATAFLFPTYEAGDWIPTFGGDLTDGSLTYSRQYGRYVRFGNLVWAMFALQVNILTTAPTNILRIKGLPFASRNVTNQIQGGAIRGHSLVNTAAGYTQLGLAILVNSTEILVSESGDNLAVDAVDGNAITNNSRIDGFVIYEV